MRNNCLMVLISVTCLSFTNCAMSRAPSGWLSEPENVPKDVYGAWVNVNAGNGVISGELIAIEQDTVFLAGPRLQAIAAKDILTLRIITYNSGSKIGFGTFGGMLLALSNGMMFVGTGPMWLIGGTIASVFRTYDPVFDYPSANLRHLAMYARFPQGLPENLDRTRINMKVVH